MPFYLIEMSRAVNQSNFGRMLMGTELKKQLRAHFNLALGPILRAAFPPLRGPRAMKLNEVKLFHRKPSPLSDPFRSLNSFRNHFLLRNVSTVDTFSLSCLLQLKVLNSVTVDEHFPFTHQHFFFY